jgi:hypothetical protein
MAAARARDGEEGETMDARARVTLLIGLTGWRTRWLVVRSVGRIYRQRCGDWRLARTRPRGEDSKLQLRVFSALFLPIYFRFFLSFFLCFFSFHFLFTLAIGNPEFPIPFYDQILSD